MTAQAMSETPSTIMIESLDEFVQALVGWHQNRVATLKHIMEVPEGTEVMFNEDAPTVLEGDVRKGFVLGLRCALEQLGELPFEAEIEYTETPPAH